MNAFTFLPVALQFSCLVIRVVDHTAQLRSNIPCSPHIPLPSSTHHSSSASPSPSPSPSLSILLPYLSPSPLLQLDSHSQAALPSPQQAPPTPPSTPSPHPRPSNPTVYCHNTASSAQHFHFARPSTRVVVRRCRGFRRLAGVARAIRKIRLRGRRWMSCARRKVG